MKLPNEQKLESDRFFYRPLVEADATPKYLSWLSDNAAIKFIKAAKDTKEIEDLKLYIQSKLDSEDALFLGIFDSATDSHIGNVKYEPINFDQEYAVMGILVGDPGWRGKGVAQESILFTSKYLKSTFGISEIILGVEKDNKAAIRTYEKIGFSLLHKDPRFTDVETAHFMGLKEF